MYRILIVEDDRLIRENIMEILRLHEIEVHGAENGRQGLELAELLQPDLIFCDMLMDELDGYQVLQILREQPQTAQIPFVFLSAISDRHTVRQAMDAGADDYLIKPFTVTDLLHVVDVWVTYRRSIAQR